MQKYIFRHYNEEYKVTLKANTYKNNRNIITVNFACDIVLEYYPIVKGVGL